MTHTSVIPQSSQSTHQNLTTDAYLNQLVRQSYLDCRKLGDGKPGAAGGAKKRGRGPGASQMPRNGAEDEENQYEWRWGSRAFAEVGEVAIAQFVAEFMVLRGRVGEGEGDDDENGKDNPSVKKGIEKMMNGIEKAAAGRLVDIHGVKLEKTS